ncbi:hypothetical protein ACWCPJ_35950 [Streptomyces collinus]
MEAAYRSGAVSIGRPPVSHEDVEQARAALQRAETRFADLGVSRPNTLRALKALDAAVRDPSPSDAPAARAARIAAQSRERAAAPAAPRTSPAADQVHQAHNPSPQHHQSGLRPT